MPSSLPQAPARSALEIAAAAGPAVLASFFLCGLALFLNPELPLSAGVLARGTGWVAAALVPLSVAFHALLARFSGVAPRRIVPWTLFCVLATFAATAWYDAAHYGFFLPPGIDSQLVKTALWLSLGALLVFYTALLHSVHRRRYGRRSQALFLAVAIGTMFALFDRRANYRPPPPGPPRLPGIENVASPQLLVVGIDTATLDVILPLADQGKLPFFSRLLNEGAAARLVSLAPARELPLWATLATGKLPYRHGLIGDELYFVPWIGGERPLRLLPWSSVLGPLARRAFGSRAATADDSEALPVWEILARLERRVGAVGFAAALSPSRGLPLEISQEFFTGDGGRVAPAELRARGQRFRVEPAGLDAARRRAFADAQQPELAAALAGDRWRSSLVSFLLGGEDRPEALFLRLPGLASASRATFGGFQAATFEGARAGAAQRAAAALAAYYVDLDQQLASLWATLPAPRLLAVVSEVGVEPPSLAGRLLAALGRRSALSGDWREAPDGLLLLAGNGIRAGTRLVEADLSDLVPTLLYALGLPIARDFDGRVLTGAFDPAFLQQNPLTFVASYEGLPTAVEEPVEQK
ncbi:MAG: alkaline phosphatase family protein [Thermoanaerobaculia bacterium]